MNNGPTVLEKQGQQSVAPEQSATFRAVRESAMANVKPSSIIKGFEASKNLHYFVLLVAFTLWVGVVYLVRTHEPEVNKAIGATVPSLTPEGNDKALISGTNSAYPVSYSGTKMSNPNVSSILPAVMPSQGGYIPAGPGQAQSANAVGEQQFRAPAQYLDESQPSYGYQPPMVYKPMSHMPGASISPSAYNMPISAVGGVRLQTVVSR